ncbi:MAG: Asparagine synthetase [glutamine-hydrolyzing] 1 [Alphaproteobacteria bacterium MarineAlpha8_Bin1]|nr:MAG: Asparagine synthetase [glutamine-hydrolyzing] 1 [Alphaproteobacteria bacterium MarineAlpha8_Bin1]
MCGIVGCVDYKNIILKEEIIKMNDDLSHRGPDSKGIWAEEDIILGHSRLAVLDTNKRSNQPMLSNDRRYVIVFNGEIYNFREIKFELKKRGMIFKTNSDTEVLLSAYKVWGEELVLKLNGMFAFAIWDRELKSLFLARDRIGEKPLYYKLKKDAIIFSSEFDVLINKFDQSKINKNKIFEFLEYNYVSNSKTLFDDINQLPPGHILIKKRGGEIKIKSYWNILDCFKKKIKISEKDAAYRISELIDESTKLRMISDVPLGIFLSGGIDSAVITSSMKKVSNNLKILSVGFKDQSYDESAFADETAQSLGCSAQKIFIDNNKNNIESAINCAAKNLLADNSAIPFWLMSKEAKKYVKVSLTGDGADEMFAGYETYIADKLAYKYLRYVPQKFWKILTKIIKKSLPVSFTKISSDFKLRQFINGIQEDWPDTHFSWRKIFNKDDMQGLLNPELLREYNNNNFSHGKNLFSDKLDNLDNALLSDIKTWLVDCLLIKADRMSMAHGLEVRAPFLDHKLVEFVASLPSNLKLKGFTKKYILKNSQKNRLNSKILKRKKSGFNAPINLWLSSFLKDFAGDMIFSKSLRDLFQYTYLEKIWKDHQKKKADNSFKIYNLLILSLWLQNKQKYLQ